MKKQTAGRDNLGYLAPEFAKLNDDVLFGQVWSREDKLSLRDRSMITIAALFSSGLYPQLKAHLELGREHGIKKEEVVEIFTQLAFYCGWPKAWSAFELVKEVYGTQEILQEDEKSCYQNTIMFPIGQKNDAYAKYFVGQSYLAAVGSDKFPIANVTFSPGCRNNWHIHRSDVGGGQTLICIGGRGYYQQWGKDPVEMLPGKVVNIAAGVKHWHGAANNSWFSHLAFEIPGENTSTQWLEAVSDQDYMKIQ